MAGMLVAFLIWVKAELNLLIDKENSPRTRASKKEGWIRLLVAPRRRVCTEPHAIRCLCLSATGMTRTSPGRLRKGEC